MVLLMMRGVLGHVRSEISVYIFDFLYPRVFKRNDQTFLCNNLTEQGQVVYSTLLPPYVKSSCTLSVPIADRRNSIKTEIGHTK